MKCVALGLALLTATAHADEPAPEPSSAQTPEELAKRIEALEESAQQVDVLEENMSELHKQIKQLKPLKRILGTARVSVFLDVGWFAVGGNGAGVRSDIGHRYIKDFDNVPAEWVLIGDPLSTTINSLGEPADLGVARSITDDTIDSEGRSTFVVNTVGLPIGGVITDKISIESLLEFLPRSGPDIVAVEHAHIDYRPSHEVNLVLSAGKVESVLGIEYRGQDAPARTGITPSLLCRYLCGRPYGVRAQFVSKKNKVDLSALIASGDSFQERFERDPRLASAKAPTISAHARYLVPIGEGIKVGASFAVGPQDGQSAQHVHQWHYGFDLNTDTDKFSLQAEFIQGKQQGSSTGLSQALDVMPDPTIVAPHCTLAQCLRYKAAYGLASYRAHGKVTPYARVDWRDARHQRGVDFLYVSRVVRGTVGARFEMTNRIVGKIEYTYNYELIGPQFPNDVLTTSIVVSTE